MTNTSMDSRTRAQRYADSRWWMPGVKVVGYAIHHPQLDLSTRSVYSVELLYHDGGSLTRWICVSTSDGSDQVYDCTYADPTFFTALEVASC